MRIVVTFTVAFLLALSGCSSSAATPEGEWVLESIVTEGDAMALPSSPVDLAVEDTRIFGSTGCNSFGGGAQFDGDGSLRLDQVGVTEMACLDSALMAFESIFTQALFGVDSWTLTDREGEPTALTLSGPGVELRYVPRIAPPDLALAGPDWVPDSFYDGETVSNAAGMSDIVVSFGDDSLRAQGPCWSIAGPATIEPGGEGNMSIDFSGSEAEFFCDDRALFEEVVERLGAADAYRIDESELTLERGGEPIIGFRG